ncbi:MAG: peptidoglycan-binding domain-containing protein [Pseudomonadota bacterium]
MRRVLLSLMLAWCGTGAAWAADSEGRFAAEGVGQLTCASFNEAAALRDQTALLRFASWLDGYYTGLNAHMPDTFTALPWQDTNLLMQKMRLYCQQRPSDPFMVGVAAYTATLLPNRLQESAGRISITYGGESVIMYAPVFDEFRAKLEAWQQTPFSAPQGEFGEEIATAIKGFQRSVNLPETGLPDQLTLEQLMR